MKSLTEETIRSFCESKSFERGREYYRSGAIYNAVRQGNSLLADCEGSYTYHLRVELDESGIQSASCTCPYDYAGYCKHIIALLLTYIHEPDEFTERKSLAVLLENVDKAALVTMLAKLADRHPELYNWLETSILPAAVVTVKSAESSPKRESPVSEQAYRKRIKNILRAGSQEYDEYDSSNGVASELDEVTGSAEERLRAGDAQGAIIILMTLLDELGDTYEMFDDSDGDLNDSANFAGQLLAEAILSANLTVHERKTLEHKIAPIAKNLADYGLEDGMQVAQLALEYGWDEHQPGEQSDLIYAKLNVFERQGRTEEFLSLCQQTGQYLRHTLKLLQLGRADEAIHAASQISEPNEILQIAKTLREANRLHDAIALAERGLRVEGQNYQLAAWLAPLEEAQGRTEQALQAYLAAFAAAPSLDVYRNLQRLAGKPHWAQLKPAQISILLKSGRSDAIVSVYLYEQEWDEAIAIAEKNSYDYTLREKVADAVILHRPDWVIHISIQEAEKLLVPTQSKYYPHAVRWFAKVKEAYLQSNRKAEWLAYFTQLKNTYARRPSLTKELAKLN